MAIREILQLGNPDLYEVSDEVEKDELDLMRDIASDLEDTMLDFRERYSAGRAIAAPQIGVRKRMIYMNAGEPVVLLNPEITEQSADMIEVWDDCMSFPELLVRVRRHSSIKVAYRDLDWNEKELEAQGDLSELLQHEIDHLNGILAVMRAIDDRSFVTRSERWRVKET
jgi:peptide deformylase